MRDVAAKRLKQLKRLTRAQTMLSELARLQSLQDQNECKELEENMRSLDDLIKCNVKVSILPSFYIGYLQNLSRKKAEAESRLLESSRTVCRENDKLRTVANREKAQRSRLSRLDEDERLSITLENWNGASD